LVFRLDLNSTFNEIKKKCCKIWTLNDQAYSLYDDAFNNLECCSNEKSNKESIDMNEFFNSHKTYDASIKDTQVVFYLVEKLKLQTELLDSQKRCKKIF
jgi:hypothetical protein